MWDTAVPAQAELLEGLLDLLGVGRCALVGHDLGGAVGQLLAVDRPERLARLVLVDTVSYAHWLAGDIPGPRLIVEEVGHFVMEEVPDRGADEVVAFLSRSPGAW